MLLFDIRVINNIEIMHETLSFKIFIYCTNKSRVKLEMNTPFTFNAMHFLTMLMILSATRPLLTSEFMMSFDLTSHVKQQHPLSHTLR